LASYHILGLLKSIKRGKSSKGRNKKARSNEWQGKQQKRLEGGIAIRL
jgi:hypothetical protein